MNPVLRTILIILAAVAAVFGITWTVNQLSNH